MVEPAVVGAAICKIAAKAGSVSSLVLGSLGRIQALLAKANEKPYQARLLEARLNSCKALLQSLANTRIDAVHLEPLRIKLAHIEEMVQRAGDRIYIYKFTDESLAKEFESASAQLQEEEATLALVVQALPRKISTGGYRGLRLSPPPRRRTRSRSSSSRRSGSRSKSPMPQIGESAQDAFALTGAQMANAVVTESEHEITLTGVDSVDDAKETSPVRGGRSIVMRTTSCCSQEEVSPVSENQEDTQMPLIPSITVTEHRAGDSQRSRCTKALIPFDLIADLLEPPDDDAPGNHALQGSSRGAHEPLPPIEEVEREMNTFWQDTVTLVFRCGMTGQEHRVETQQWSRPACTDTAGDRLVSWASKPFQTSKPWEEIMEESALTPTAQMELKELLQKSGWYDKFTFDADCKSWVAKEAAIVKECATSNASGYVPCTED